MTVEQINDVLSDMEKKQVLEFIGKNLEEIKILFENISQEEGVDPLLIELTALKAKAFYKELKLLLPDIATVHESINPSNPIILSDREIEEVAIEEQLQISGDLLNFSDSTPIIVEVQDERPNVTPIEENEEFIAPPEIISEEESVETISEEESVIEEEKNITEEIIPIVLSEDKPETENSLEEQINEIEANEDSELQIADSKEPEKYPVEEKLTEESTVFIAEETTTENVLSDNEIDNSEVRNELPDEEIAIEEKTEIQSDELIEDIEKKIEDPTVILNEDSIAESLENPITGEPLVKEPSLNEKLASIASSDSKIKGQPITSLKSAIGLNDRFLFMRELFNGDYSCYETTIEELDKLGSLIEAIEFLEKNFQWTKNNASLKFMELIKRRFEH